MRLPSGLNVALGRFRRCRKSAYLMAGYIPKVPSLSRLQSEVHIVGTEHREGRWRFLMQGGRQYPIDVPEASGAIV